MFQAAEDPQDDEWVDISNEEDIPSTINFDIGPQVSSTVTEPIQVFKLFFTDELVGEIIIETNTYARTKLKSKVSFKNSIWYSWRDVQKDEFWAFIGVILNMGTM